MADTTVPTAVEPADELALTAPDVAPARRMFAGSGHSVDTEALDASLSAIASAHTGSLKASGSAVGLADVSGNAEIGTSAVGIMTTQGDGTVKQSYLQAFVAGERVDMQQSASAAVIARTITFDRSASLISLSGDAEVRSGTVGILLSGRSSISENARVIVTGRTLAVLALVLFGGLGLIAVAVYFGAQEIASKLPELKLPQLPLRRRASR